MTLRLPTTHCISRHTAAFGYGSIGLIVAACHKLYINTSVTVKQSTVDARRELKTRERPQCNEIRVFSV